MRAELGRSNTGLELGVGTAGGCDGPLAPCRGSQALSVTDD